MKPVPDLPLGEGGPKLQVLELLGWVQDGDGVVCVTLRHAVLVLPPALVYAWLENGA